MFVSKYSDDVNLYLSQNQGCLYLFVMHESIIICVCVCVSLCVYTNSNFTKVWIQCEIKTEQTDLYIPFNTGKVIKCSKNT